MRTLPEGLDEHELLLSLVDGWNLEIEGIEYLPEGRGSYHWRVVDAQGQRHFVTVDDLDNKGWLGDCRDSVFQGLRQAFDTAAALRVQGGLDFVVAPIPTVDPATLFRIGSRYTVAVFSWLDGQSRLGQLGTPYERADVVRMLAELHQATSAVTATAPYHRLELANRPHLDAAIDELNTTWEGGPFSEPARAVLDGHATSVASWLEAFDRLAGEVATRAIDPVITHGEPHGRNVMRVGSDLVLFDWDTVGLAPPERDLWMVATPSREETAAYSDATDRDVDQSAMTLYRLRWKLDDIAIFVRMLRSPHVATEDTELTWLGLTSYLDGVDWSPFG